MKNELLEKLEELLAAENPLEVQKEFNVVSAQLKSLFASSQPAAKEKKEPESAESIESDKPLTAEKSPEAVAEAPAEEESTDGPIPSPTNADNEKQTAESHPNPASTDAPPSGETAESETEENLTSAAPADSGDHSAVAAPIETETEANPPVSEPAETVEAPAAEEVTDGPIPSPTNADNERQSAESHPNPATTDAPPSGETAESETEINPTSAAPLDSSDHSAATASKETEAKANNPKPEPAETVEEASPSSDVKAETPSKEEISTPEAEPPKQESLNEKTSEATEITEASDEGGEPLKPGGEKAEAATDTSDEAQAKFKELTATFKSKVSSAREAIKRLEEETVATAKDLLTELQNLVENEENIGKAFAGFNAIQEKWKSLPRVSNDNYRDLNVEYNKMIERFFYNINIYKELKELDLKRNLEEKQKVLETQKNLLDVKDIRLLEVEVRMNQDRWNEIGPTFKEEWDKIKDEFWEVTRTIYKKIQDFYNQRKEEQERNLEVKKELLEEVKQIEALELKAHKKWQEKTKEVIELQKKWKMVGFVPKDKAKSVWKEFRETCDSFFEKKRAHYAEIRKEQDANRDAKEALLREAEELKDSTDWKEASNRLINLQKKWKEIGAAHQRDENKLWKKFRAACDHFFQARNAQKAENTEQEKENLKAKEEIIEKLQAFAPDPSDKGAIEELKSFSEAWRKIGHVPFKEKDKINKAYKQLMDEKFAILKVDRREKEKMRFEEKVDLLKSSDAKDKLVRKEQDFIRSKISKIESEINQYENNLGFFANSKGAEKMKEEVVKKIDKAKQDVDALYAQLEVLDEVE